MGKFDYEAQLTVKAAQWRGDNLEEMKELLQDVVEEDFDGTPCVYADYIEPYFLRSLGDRDGYYMLKTEHDEFDPGMWVVVYDNGDYEGMCDEEFNRMYRKRS